MTDTVRCYACCLFCGESYGTEFFLLDAEVYCSLNCYKEQRLKDELNTGPEVQPKKKKRKK